MLNFRFSIGILHAAIGGLVDLVCCRFKLGAAAPTPAPAPVPASPLVAPGSPLVAPSSPLVAPAAQPPLS